MRRAVEVGLALVVAALLSGCGLWDDDEGARTGAAAGLAVAEARCDDAPSDGAAVVVPRVLTERWRLASRNAASVHGCVLWNGQPVEGVGVRVGRYNLRTPTDESGRFQYTLDSTLASAREVAVADVSEAKVDGESLDEEARRELLAAGANLRSHFKLSEIEARRRDDGSILVTGRAAYADGAPPLPVVLFAYQLSGRVTDHNGQPVKGGRVSTRNLEEGLEAGWTLSELTDAEGNYVDFFYPSAPPGLESQLVVRVGKGGSVWEFPEGQTVEFPRLRSAVMDIQLPPPNFALAEPAVRPRDGAVYEGLLVGVVADGVPVEPLRARWPDAQGRFAMVLPGSTAGKTVAFWHSFTYVFSGTPARPGGPIDTRYWPERIPPGSPDDVARVALPG